MTWKGRLALPSSEFSAIMMILLFFVKATPSSNITLGLKKGDRPVVLLMGLLGNRMEVRLLFDENNMRSFQAKGEEEKLRSEEEKKDLLTAF
jgi:hypothetical protein